MVVVVALSVVTWGETALPFGNTLQTLPPPLLLSELVIAAVTLCCLCFWCALHDTESYMQAEEDAI